VKKTCISQEKVVYLGKFEKLQFEIHGILLTSKVTISTTIPKLPSLSKATMLDIIEYGSISQNA